MRYILFILLAFPFLLTQTSMAQESESDEIADVDQREDELVEKFVDLGSNIEKEVGADLKNEAKRELGNLKKNEYSPSVSPDPGSNQDDDSAQNAGANPQSTPGDSIAAIERDVDKLEESGKSGLTE